MLLDTCQFRYIARNDSEPKRVLGIERSWEELKKEMNRTGPGYSNATYFKTISYEGPQLFAVVDDNLVLYHDLGKWHQYITAYDVKFGTIECSNINPDRAISENEIIHKTSDETEWIFVSHVK